MAARTIFLAAAISATLAHGQSLRAPIAGYVHSPATAAVHPITGIPGASILGAPVLTGIQAASLSTDGDAAIAVRGDGLFAITGILSGFPEVQLIAPESASHSVSWGTDGAVTWTPSSTVLLTRLAKSWTLTPLSLGLPPGPVTAIDYDESAGRIYLSLASGDENSGVYLFSISDAALSRVQALSDPGPISGNYAVNNKTSVISLATGETIYESEDPILGIHRGAHLYIAGRDQIKVLCVFCESSASLATSSALSLPTPATRFQRLGNSTLFLLTTDPTQPTYLLDTARSGVFFIPATGGAN